MLRELPKPTPPRVKFRKFRWALRARGPSSLITGRHAERAVNEYWDATFVSGRKNGLRLIQIHVLEQRNAVVGAQRSLADVINDYIETKLTGDERL